jgi:hypothetical protein
VSKFGSSLPASSVKLAVACRSTKYLASLAARFDRIAAWTFLTALTAALIWPTADALAACTPTAPVSNTTVNCNGPVINQNNPDGYGTGAESNDAINVQTGSVTGTSSGFNVLDGNTFTLSSGTAVTGGANGIAATGNGTTTLNNNGGMVSGNGANAFVDGFVSPGSLTGTNSGTISAVTTAMGGSAIAVNPSTSVNYTNAGGATISATGNGGEAVGIQSNAVTLNNAGTITVTGGTGSGSFGVFGLNAVNVTNSGMISADDAGGSVESIAIVSNGTLNVTNNGGTIQATGFNGVGVLGSDTTTVQNNGGTISGSLDGVNTNTAATTSITNSGMIAGTGRDGIRVNTASVTNNAGGTVTGATGIFFRAGNGPSTVFDAGTITGTGGTAIQFSTGSVSNSLTLGPGFVINGNVLGAGSDIFQLGGTTGTGSFNLSNIGAQYTGFGTFNVISQTWNATGTSSQNWTIFPGATLQLVDGNAGNGGNGTITGNVTDNGTFAVNRSDTYTFGSLISGTGAVQQNGTGTLVLTNVDTYNGATTVNAGTLEVDGSIATSILATVNGGILRGIGAVGNTQINTGTLAPGNTANPTGTLTVTGSLTF